MTTSPTAKSVEFSVTMGASTEDGRGNITAYASVRDNEKVLQRDRDYSSAPVPTDRTQGVKPDPRPVVWLRWLGERTPPATSATSV